MYKGFFYVGVIIVECQAFLPLSLFRASSRIAMSQWMSSSQECRAHLHESTIFFIWIVSVRGRFFFSSVSFFLAFLWAHSRPSLVLLFSPYISQRMHSATLLSHWRLLPHFMNLVSLLQSWVCVCAISFYLFFAHLPINIQTQDILST